MLLDDLSWSIGPGCRIGLVGVNGTGKTTLLRLLIGELRPDSRPGQARTDAADRASEPEHRRARGTKRVLEVVEEQRRVDRTRRRRRGEHEHAAGGLRLHPEQADDPAGRPVRWRTAPACSSSGSAADRAQRAAARRADQRSGHRHPDRDRGLPRHLARHADRGQPRPVLPGAGLRRYLRADRRRSVRAAARAASSSTWPIDGRRIQIRRLPASGRAAVGSLSPDRTPVPPAAGRGPPGSQRAHPTRVTAAKLDVRITQLHAEMATSASDYAQLATLQTELDELLASKDDLEIAWLEAAERARLISGAARSGESSPRPRCHRPWLLRRRPGRPRSSGRPPRARRPPPIRLRPAALRPSRGEQHLRPGLVQPAAPDVHPAEAEALPDDLLVRDAPLTGVLLAVDRPDPGRAGVVLGQPGPKIAAPPNSTCSYSCTAETLDVASRPTSLLSASRLTLHRARGHPRRAKSVQAAPESGLSWQHGRCRLLEVRAARRCGGHRGRHAGELPVRLVPRSRRRHAASPWCGRPRLSRCRRWSAGPPRTRSASCRAAPAPACPVDRARSTAASCCRWSGCGRSRSTPPPGSRWSSRARSTPR